ncbi:hypothetical protein L1987_58658 [Smallanthus sonchifolius]|uniref:Uncharacterized protein n=1 Tax=Smallanthus sonchifolius TaxID=185202 RepID=A0ACB9DFX9_9ASTR|nr:hypothetical protein L1987_58658 [Smallanthus sonchifolius]
MKCSRVQPPRMTRLGRGSGSSQVGVRNWNPFLKKDGPVVAPGEQERRDCVMNRSTSTIPSVSPSSATDRSFSPDSTSGGIGSGFSSPGCPFDWADVVKGLKSGSQLSGSHKDDFHSGFVTLISSPSLNITSAGISSAVSSSEMASEVVHGSSACSSGSDSIDNADGLRVFLDETVSQVVTSPVTAVSQAVMSPVSAGVRMAAGNTGGNPTEPELNVNVGPVPLRTSLPAATSSGPFPTEFINSSTRPFPAGPSIVHTPKPIIVEPVVLEQPKSVPLVPHVPLAQQTQVVDEDGFVKVHSKSKKKKKKKQGMVYDVAPSVGLPVSLGLSDPQAQMKLKGKLHVSNQFASLSDPVLDNMDDFYDGALGFVFEKWTPKHKEYYFHLSKEVIKDQGGPNTAIEVTEDADVDSETDESSRFMKLL